MLHKFNLVKTNQYFLCVPLLLLPAALLETTAKFLLAQHDRYLGNRMISSYNLSSHAISFIGIFSHWGRTNEKIKSQTIFLRQCSYVAILLLAE